MKKIRLGIVGLGSHGTGHTRNILSGMCPELEITAVCDIDPDRLAVHKETFGEFPAFINYSDMIDSGLIDAILIVTPHYFHPPIAMEAIAITSKIMPLKSRVQNIPYSSLTRPNFLFL